MNKKVLGFFLVSNMLVGSVSGVVSAKDYKKQSYFIAPKDGPIPEKVVVAINHAVIEWNDLCEFASDYSKFSEKEQQNILEKLEEKEIKVLALRKKADDLIKSEKCEKEIIIRPWDDERKVNTAKDSYGPLFNFLGYNCLFDHIYNLDESYGSASKIYENKDVIFIESNTSKLKDNSKLSRLNADYKFYSNIIAIIRQIISESKDRQIGEEISLLLFFQAREWTRKEIIKEEEKQKQTCQKQCHNCLNDCSIF